MTTTVNAAYQTTRNGEAKAARARAMVTRELSQQGHARKDLLTVTAVARIPRKHYPTAAEATAAARNVIAPYAHYPYGSLSASPAYPAIHSCRRNWTVVVTGDARAEDMPDLFAAVVRFTCAG